MRLFDIYWRVRRPTTLGVKGILWCGDEVLLIRARGQQLWGLPGGGVKPGERYDAALNRELHEELGLSPLAWNLVGVYLNTRQGKRDYITVYQTHLEKIPPMRSNWEIREWCWSPRHALPVDTGEATRRRIQEAYRGDPVSDWWLASLEDRR